MSPATDAPRRCQGGYAGFMGAGVPERVFIFGGCASRDAVEFYPPHMELAGYVARQSVISAYSHATEDGFELSGVKSSFQRRMFAGDIAGNAFERIREASPDLIVWDLNIERVGVARLPAGGLVTASTAQRGWVGPGRLRAPIRFGTDAHFSLFSRMAARFLADLESVGLADRVVVNATPWAPLPAEEAQIAAGVEAERFSARWFNQTISRYHQFLETRGVPLVCPPHEVVRARLDHKWGPGPFHYIEDTYRAMVAAIDTFVDQRSALPPPVQTPDLNAVGFDNSEPGSTTEFGPKPRSTDELLSR